MIKKEEIKHIANLAHLGLTEKELDSMQKNFSSILDYIETLKEADISSVEKAFSERELKNITREDIQKETPENERNKLIDMFPETKNNYLKTKKVL